MLYSPRQADHTVQNHWTEHMGVEQQQETSVWCETPCLRPQWHPILYENDILCHLDAAPDYYRSLCWGLKKPLSINGSNRVQQTSSTAPCTPHKSGIPAGMSQVGWVGRPWPWNPHPLPCPISGLAQMDKLSHCHLGFKPPYKRHEGNRETNKDLFRTITFFTHNRKSSVKSKRL